MSTTEITDLGWQVWVDSKPWAAFDITAKLELPSGTAKLELR